MLAGFNRVRPDYVVKWNNWIPKKVGMVAWRALKERLPTRVALQRRGVTVQNLDCILCSDFCETSDYLFVSCVQNDLMFAGKTKSIANVVEEIKAKSFVWVKYRSKEVNMSWDQWRIFDVF
ncbi:uncharacterized protein LOC118490565 [Helianthus annuus]|uniref:uncharacterized protein LOC118490565 n=1 Tax=Helianthus annuus TaxID=4232 RepID=UPI001652DA28|nr:uncharacterized protein LOC118490565 [Helianthus annuus]